METGVLHRDHLNQPFPCAWAGAVRVGWRCLPKTGADWVVILLLSKPDVLSCFPKVL